MNDNSKAHVNDVIKTMLERSSIRAYTDEKLTQEQISLLRNAALSAPTAMNAQDQRFVFVTNAEIIAELEAGVVEAACAGGDAAFAERIKQRGGKIMYDAPLFVGIFAHPAKFSGVDAAVSAITVVSFLLRDEVTFFTGKALRTASFTWLSHMPHIIPVTRTVYFHIFCRLHCCFY